MGVNERTAHKRVLKSVQTKSKIMLTLLISMLLVSCQTDDKNETQSTFYSSIMTTSTQAGVLYNYDRQGLNALKMAFNQTNQKQLHIVQLGDSHTAADVFTGQIRKILQKKYGDGGIGFIPAADIKGIRSDLVLLESSNKNWDVLTSRKEESTIFPLGGYQVNTKNKSGNILIKPRKTFSSNVNAYDAKVLYHTNTNQHIKIDGKNVNLNGNGAKWQWSPFVTGIEIPVTITIDNNKNLTLGGFYLSSSAQNGVVLSTLGINGAQATYWDKWHPSWIQSLKDLDPRVIILAYGTNEAYEDGLDLNAYKRDLNNRIKFIKSEIPNATLILVGPPDSMKTRGEMASNACGGAYSAHLANIIQIQNDLAKMNQIMFWNWQEAMGGDCSFKDWIAKGLAKEDMVHLTADGYKKSGEKFSRDLIRLLELQN